MSKVKVSMSFVFAMLLIGLFSAVTFAATQLSAPTSLDVKAADNGKVTISWQAVTNATDYTISVKDGEGTVVLVPTSTSNATSYEVSGLAVEERYTASVVAVGDATYSNSVARETGFVTHNQDTKVDPGDNGLNNANQTGLGDLNKAVKNQHTHGDYKNNTNSCASCHQTHTASGDTLLFKSSVYDTCVACHDGTLGYYNVFEIDNSKDLGGGTFGGSHAGNMSVHLANDTLEISAAPGANSELTGATWSSEFSCASCHDPHGSYSDRLLTNNPNGMAEVDRKVDAAQGLWYGNKLNDVPVIDGTTAADTTAKRKALVTGWAPGSYTTDAQSAAKALKFQVTATDVAAGGDYAGLGLKEGDWIVQLYRWDDSIASKWVPTPFLQSGGNSGDGIDFATGLEATTTNDLNGTAFYNPEGGSNGAWKGKVSHSKAGAQPGWIVNGAKGFVKVGPLYDTSDANYGKLTGTIGGVTTQLYPTGKLLSGSTLPLTDVAAFTTAFNAACADTASKITHVTNVESVQVTKLGTMKDTGIVMPNGVHVMKTDLTAIVGKNVANGYNYYCAACHVDYLSSKGASDINTANGGTGVGTGDTKYKHHSMSSNYTCARCHFAHGTDVDWMRDATGRTVADLQNVVNPSTSVKYTKEEAEAYMLDVNPSSALKRYTNMSVCYGCHTSSHSEVIVNDGTYATSADQVNSINVDGTTSFFNNTVAVPKIVGQH